MVEPTRFHFVIFGVFLCFLTRYSDGLTGPSHNKVVVCYVSSWAVYRPEKGSFSLEDIDPALCTHLIYAFAGLNATSNTIRSLDTWQDLKADYGKGGYERITALKNRYPHLRVSLAIGGWNEGSANYSKMAASPASRKAFINSVVQFLRRYGFDGFDLDWEYPAKRGGEPQDRENFVSLVKELKEEFTHHNYILTSAIGAGPDTIDDAYDIPQLSKYLDYLHLMCYDYHGTWDGVVGPNAPLHGYHDRDQLSVEKSIEHILKLGAPREKLVVGVPVYGRAFIREMTPTPTDSEIEMGVTRTKSVGFAGPFTREAGFLGFNEISLELMNASAGWIIHWDERSKTPYAVSGDKILCYDNERSIAAKVRHIMQMNLAGVMAWAIDTDDFRGAAPQASDTYTDYYNNLRKMQTNKFFNEIVPELQTANVVPRDVTGVLPSGSSFTRSTYRIQNGEILLSILPRSVSNFPLMRTIDESVTLAQQETAIQAFLDRKIREKERENEIPQSGDNRQGGGVSSLSLSFSLLLVAIASNIPLKMYFFSS